MVDLSGEGNDKSMQSDSDMRSKAVCHEISQVRSVFVSYGLSLFWDF